MKSVASKGNVKSAVHQHEDKMHRGEPKTKIKLKGKEKKK